MLAWLGVLYCDPAFRGGSGLNSLGLRSSLEPASCLPTPLPDLTLSGFPSLASS